MDKRLIASILAITFTINSLFPAYASFEDSLHMIRNPKTNASKVFKGNGEVVLTSKDPAFETIEIIKDVITGETPYCCKIIEGEKINERKYTDGETNSTYVEKLPSRTTIFYDKDGKELDLKVDNCYGAHLAYGDYIAYYDDTDNGSDNHTLKLFNIKTKQIITPPHRCLEVLGDKIILSSDPYYDKDTPKEIFIYDKNMKPLKEIHGYSYTGSANLAGKEIGRIMKEKANENDASLYNYIDKDLNLIFDKDVSTSIYDGDKATISIVSGNKQFFFDFNKMKKVGEVKEYNKDKEEKKSKWDILREEHAASSSIVLSFDPKYNYIDPKEYNGKVIYFANYECKDPSEQYENSTDLYDINCNFIASFSVLNGIYDEVGRFFVNYNTMYDFDLNEIYKYQKDSNIELFNKVDKYYFIDPYDKNNKRKEKYNFYDTDMNVLMGDIYSSDFYAFEKYILAEDNKSTKVYDKDLKIIKDIGTKVDIQNSSPKSKEGHQYFAFKNRDTNRMGIMDENFNILLNGLKNCEMLEEDYFTFQKGFKYGFMDYKGNELISFSIFDTMNEDTQDTEKVYIEEYHEN